MHGGRLTHFDGIARNISMSGVVLEASVDANLWVDKQLVLHLPGGTGPVAAHVRRFLDYAEGGRKHTRWGIEFAELSVVQRGQWPGSSSPRPTGSVRRMLSARSTGAATPSPNRGRRPGVHARA